MRFLRMINLNQTEQQFIAYLDTFSRTLTPPVECRIAGGWVRDKLLSLPSHDLDIALTIPSGHSFAVDFVEYLKKQGITTGSVGKVAVNPEQSKHLETGTTKILGLECDFVGLRSETYADTRIPEVRPGTPLEDASRRDLTINALFYNVHSREVEDHTGKGLTDLEKRIARTPLPPLQTFHDDPLRVIRCVRFASRFDLSIEPDVRQAIQDSEITAALATKVSKERIGIEITKMLNKTPYSALSLITQLGLHPAVFKCGEYDPPRDAAMPYCEILQQLPGEREIHPYHWFAAALSPFDGMIVGDKKKVPAVANVISEGLKLGNDVRDGVAKLFEAATIIDPSATKRSVIGTMLQHPSVRPWDRSIVWAIVSAIKPTWSGQWDDNAAQILARYDAFIARIHELNLPADIDQAPILDGNAIKTILQIKPSPILAFIRQAVNEWQLDNPEGTREEAEAWLMERWQGDERAVWEAEAQKVMMKGKKK